MYFEIIYKLNTIIQFLSKYKPVLNTDKYISFNQVGIIFTFLKRKTRQIAQFYAIKQSK